MSKRANGEGTLYITIQKIPKNFDNTQMCKVCATCTDRTICNDRQGYIKCEKCKSCKEECLKYCDRFRCYQRACAQILENNERHTVGSGKTKKEANDKKKEKIKNGKIVNKNSITLVAAMKNFEEDKQKYKQIGENSYNRNLDTISSIEKVLEDLNISKISVQKLTEQNMKDILIEFVSSSQSQLEKVYDELNGTIRSLYENDKISYNIMKAIKRNTFISSKDRKDVQAFSISETEQIINYINKHENELVNEKRCSYDCKTIKNFIKLAFATSMRCGELGAIDIEQHINLDTKKFIVSRTLTKDKKRKYCNWNIHKNWKKATTIWFY